MNEREEQPVLDLTHVSRPRQIDGLPGKNEMRFLSERALAAIKACQLRIISPRRRDEIFEEELAAGRSWIIIL